jgi:hypothetical protein
MIAEPSYAPGQHVLVRYDGMDSENRFFWCGRALGWLPANKTTKLHHQLFPSIELAQQAADQYVTWPVNESRV